MEPFTLGKVSPLSVLNGKKWLRGIITERILGLKGVVLKPN